MTLAEIKTAIGVMPYHEEPAGVIYCGNCLSILPKMPEKCVDLVYADPPFNASRGIGIYSKRYGKSCPDNMSEAEYGRFCHKWFMKCELRSDRILVTPGVAHIGRYPLPIWTIVIHKPSSPSFNKFGGYNCWEPLLVYGKIPKGKRIPRDVVTFDSLNHKFKNLDHPCPDNLDMNLWLVDIWSNENNIICDPFLGSGSMAIAAKQLGRQFIGIEIEEKYCKIAVQRLAQEVLSV